MSPHKSSSHPKPAPEIPFHFDAAFSRSEVPALEKRHATHMGPNRRAMLVVLAMSSQEMLERFAPNFEHGTGERLAEMIKCIDQYAGYLKTTIELAEAAMARLATVYAYLMEQAGAAEGGHHE